MLKLLMLAGLMLLFVMQSDLDDWRELGQVVCRLDQPRDRVVDMTTVSGDFLGAGTRDQAALRPRVASRWPRSS